MAAITTTYFEAGLSWQARVAERNAELLAQQPMRRRRLRTPEFFFVHHIDNSRLLKISDPVRVREMRLFGVAVVFLFTLVMFYGLQHFYAIEGSYRVEQQKATLNQLREENRQLRLSQAELTQPGRIDTMARSLGLVAPQPGQVVHPNMSNDPSAPVEARMAVPAQPAR